MGKILNAYCSCEHHFESVIVGVGMRSYLTNRVLVLFYCDNCGTLTNSNAKNKTHHCLKCNNELIMYGKFYGSLGDEEVPNLSDKSKYIFTTTIAIDLEYVLEKKKNHCPNCKTNNLQFTDGGIWD